MTGLKNPKMSNRIVQFLLKSLRKIFAIFLFLVSKISFNRLPPLPVVSVIVERKGKLLGIERSDGLGISLPAGIINWDETPKEAVLREAKEETGLTLKITDLFGVYSQPRKEITNLNIVNIVYLGKVKTGKIENSFEGKAGWFTYTQIFQKDTGFRNIINDYLKSRRLSEGIS